MQGRIEIRHTMREADRYTEIEPRIQAYERQDRGMEKVQNHIEFLKAITQRTGERVRGEILKIGSTKGTSFSHGETVSPRSCLCKEERKKEINQWRSPNNVNRLAQRIY